MHVLEKRCGPAVMRATSLDALGLVLSEPMSSSGV